MGKKVTREKILKKLHPGTFSVFGSFRHVFGILFLIALAPLVAYFLVLIVRLFMMCSRKGVNPLTFSAVLRGLKTSVVSHNNDMVATVRKQALNGEEEDMEQTALTDTQESRETVEDLSKRTRHLETQVRELLGRLGEAEEKVSVLVAGQISLKASVADATRENGTPSSYDKRF